MGIVNFVNKEGKQVIPIRIREARLAREMSLADLAELLCVSKQVISKYELGAINIPGENLLEISNILNFPIGFFFKPKKVVNNYSESTTFFRSLRTTSKKCRDSQEQKIKFIEEIFNYLSDFIEFPDVDLPNNLIKEYSFNLSDEDIEEAAIKLREYWELGNKPIRNLTSLLLRKGFIVSRVGLNTYNIDAFSKWVNGKPFIVLGSDKKSGVRSRFDLAHELGHLVLHSHLDDDTLKKNIKIIENEAQRFASAFLLPEDEFVKDIYNVSLNNFIALKEKWKVSIAAMVYRCSDLNIIGELQKNNLYKQLAIKKWKRVEPLDDIIELEKPAIFQEAIDLLIENNVVTIFELIESICLDDEELENILFLEEGYFKKKKNNGRSNLKLIK